MIEYAKKKGPRGIQLGGICCTANEIFQRHGVPPAGTFLQQELAIITGACDAMVVDVQCVFQNLANVAKCFHTKLITTHPMAKMEQDNVFISSLTNTMPWKMPSGSSKWPLTTSRIVVGGHDSPAQSHQIAGFGVEVDPVPSGRNVPRRPTTP
jgi:anaerobic carbon-monoxide dehydrogenase catalytic subunit